jgi:hypothetical protein
VGGSSSEPDSEVSLSANLLVVSLLFKIPRSLLVYLVRLAGGGLSAMMMPVFAEQLVSIWLIDLWERFARSGSEENINEDLRAR